MYRSKIYQTAYYSKENVMPYNFDVGLFWYFKCSESKSGLKVIAFYFQSHRIAKKNKNKLLNSKHKLLKMDKSKRSHPEYHSKENFMLYNYK